MGRRSKSVRNLANLSQRPLNQTVVPSANVILDNDVENGAQINTGGSAFSEIHHQISDNNGNNSPTPQLVNAELGVLPGWVTSIDLIEKGLCYPQDVMYSLNNFLLGNPNMNSPHLFRADILYDSAGELKTPKEKEALQFGSIGRPQESPENFAEDIYCAAGLSINGSNLDAQITDHCVEKEDETQPEVAPSIPGFVLKRTVVRKLIPRNPNLDKPLNQTCHYYEGSLSSSSRSSDVEEGGNNIPFERTLYLSLPHIKSIEELPFYHPHIRGLALLYDYRGDSSIMAAQEHPSNEKRGDKDKEGSSTGNGTLSLHFLPFPSKESFDPFSARLERILHNILSTHIRLARSTHLAKSENMQSGLPSGTPKPEHHGSRMSKKQEDESYNPDKDNILPRHMVQNTYSRLKMTYSRDLCQRWAESTEPSKHVFEDLMIASFLIELWRNMYGVAPKVEREKEPEQALGSKNIYGTHELKTEFSGFVDIACGNGVLVYVLLMEGYQGWGFDARRRKTWSIFPEWIQSKLKESICIPKPFLDECASTTNDRNEDERTETTPLAQSLEQNGDLQYTTADFARDTFVISNHADELTVWTPLLAALACPEAPLPFLSIPCCSHSLSGARYRYPPPKQNSEGGVSTTNSTQGVEENFNNSKTGDLKALRAEKQAASTSHPGSNSNSTAVLNSMYGSLTAKTMSIAEEIGYDVERTLLRIPSTRNMGVIGGRKDIIHKWRGLRVNSDDQRQIQRLKRDPEDIRRILNEVIDRECGKEGGVHLAARKWIERAVKLQRGKNH